MHVRPPEPERRPRPAPPSSYTCPEFVNVPKKRGRKPKLRLCYNEDPDSCPEPTKRSKLEEQVPHGLSKMSRHIHHQGETSDNSVIQLTRRFQEKTTITPKSSNDKRQVGTVGLSQTVPLSTDVGHLRKVDQESHRTNSIPQPKLKHLTKNSFYRPNECSLPREQPPVVAKPPVSNDSAKRSEASWAPCLSNFDNVVVTDVTMNFLTVTIKESSSDKGFFKGKG